MNKNIQANRILSLKYEVVSPSSVVQHENVRNIPLIRVQYNPMKVFDVKLSVSRNYQNYQIYKDESDEEKNDDETKYKNQRYKEEEEKNM